MIYSKLSLRTGGGIVSELQQAEQVKNTATLLIGLGGTGIDCLKEIKKQMRVSIKPDNPGAEVPVYENFRSFKCNDLGGFQQKRSCEKA